jgi:hypothetical protein
MPMMATTMTTSTRVNPPMPGDPLFFEENQWRSLSGQHLGLCHRRDGRLTGGRSRSGGMESSKSTIRIGPLKSFPLDTAGLPGTRFPVLSSFLFIGRKSREVYYYFRVYSAF